MFEWFWEYTESHILFVTHSCLNLFGNFFFASSIVRFVSCFLKIPEKKPPRLEFVCWEKDPRFVFCVYACRMSDAANLQICYVWSSYFQLAIVIVIGREFALKPDRMLLSSGWGFWCWNEGIVAQFFFHLVRQTQACGCLCVWKAYSNSFHFFSVLPFSRLPGYRHTSITISTTTRYFCYFWHNNAYKLLYSSMQKTNLSIDVMQSCCVVENGREKLCCSILFWLEQNCK